MIKKSVIIILILLVLINSTGCYSYSTIPMDNGEMNEKLDKVRVTTSDDSVYVLRNVTIDSANVRGTASLSHTDSLVGEPTHPMILPKRKIKLIEFRSYDSTSTGHWVMIIGLALVTIYVAGSDY